ncbi:MAG: MoaD/ThiS family protein [Chloroflexi bacterium]|nr:MoaD/ThiS family protein [Chloroflexota bacterium]
MGGGTFSFEVEVFGALLPPGQRRQHLDADGPLTVRDVVLRLGLDPDDIGLATVNGVQVPLEREVPPASRVCLFPPMFGG